MRVMETIGPAWETMKRILFRPFNLGTWFSFGLMFALQSCAEGSGGNNNVRLPDTSGLGGGDAPPAGVEDLTSDSISRVLPYDVLAQSGLGGIGSTEIALIAAVVVAVAIPLVLLMLWLGSRGQMMAIHSVATGTANVGDAWRLTSSSGGRMFKFQLALAGIALGVFLPLLGVGALFVIPAVKDAAGLDGLVWLILPIALGALVVMIPFLIVKSLARNFVAPIMLRHEIGAREAWKRFWPHAREHVGSLVVFWVLGMLFSVAAAIVGIVAGFITCCLGFLPVLHQTIMAPYYVFERAWTLEILASMSPDFDLRSVPPDAHGPYGGPGGGFGYSGPGGYGGPGGFGPGGFGPGGGGPAGGGFGPGGGFGAPPGGFGAPPGGFGGPPGGFGGPPGA